MGRTNKKQLYPGTPYTPREGWAESFRAAGDSSKDPLLLEPLSCNEFDREEWQGDDAESECSDE